MSTHVVPTPKTLPARYYTDPEVFKQEMERFFCRSWVCAGRADQIPRPGDYFLRELSGESIIITRDQGGEVPEPRLRGFSPFGFSHPRGRKARAGTPRRPVNGAPGTARIAVRLLAVNGGPKPHRGKPPEGG